MMPEEGNEATGQPGNEADGQEAAPPEQQPIEGPEAGPPEGHQNGDEAIVDKALVEAGAESELPTPPEGPVDQPVEGDGQEGQDVFSRLGIDVSGLQQALEQQIGGPVPPEALKAVEEWVSDLYLNKYTPLAADLRDKAVQQQEWYQWLTGFTQSPAFQVSAQLAENPALLEQVQNWMAQGATSPAPGGQAPPEEVNLEELDPEVRRLYEDNRAMTEQLSRLTQRFDQMGQFQQTQQQAADGHRQEREAGQVGELMNQCSQAASQRLGVDVTAYPEQFAKAWEYVETNLQALLRRAEEAQRNGGDVSTILPGAHGLQQQFTTWFQDGLRLAGLDQIASDRKRQARSTPRTPVGRQPSAAGGGDPDAAIVDSALAEVGRA